MVYSCLVVGTDGSPTADRAVRHAAALAREHGARLVLATAFEGARRTGMEALAGAPPTEVAEQQAAAHGDLEWIISDRTAAEDIVGAARTVAADAGAERTVVLTDDGDPAEVLLAAAEMHGADLILVGSVGLAGAQRFVLGSVASSVLHHAPCDVLVVHTED